MENPYIEPDERPVQTRSHHTSIGRFTTVPGPRRSANGASDPGRRDPAMTPVFRRLQRIEQQHRLLGLVLLTVLIGLVITAFGYLSQGRIVTGNPLETSKELKLVDSSGRPRVFLRMHSEVPVMQVLDAQGRPRLSLGLRLDDTPFIDLSDENGATRASLQVSSGGKPTIRMYDKRGEATFTVN